jgi:hypothetical protein
MHFWYFPCVAHGTWHTHHVSCLHVHSNINWTAAHCSQLLTTQCAQVPCSTPVLRPVTVRSPLIVTAQIIPSGKNTTALNNSRSIPSVLCTPCTCLYYAHPVHVYIRLFSPQQNLHHLRKFQKNCRVYHCSRGYRALHCASSKVTELIALIRMAYYFILRGKHMKKLLLSYIYIYMKIFSFVYMHIQGVTGGMCHTSGGCSLC